MSAQPRDRLYLQHILDAIQRIETYLEELDRNSKVLVEVIKYLEKRDGRDLDGDGEIG